MGWLSVLNEKEQAQNMLPLTKVMKPGASLLSRFGGRPGEGRVALFVQPAGPKRSRPKLPTFSHLSPSCWSRLATSGLGRQRAARAGEGKCSTAWKATAGSFASASRRASVRCAVSSVMSRSGSGLAVSSSSSSTGSADAPPTVMTARWTTAIGLRSVAGLIVGPRLVLGIGDLRHFIFRPHIAAVDRQ